LSSGLLSLNVLPALGIGIGGMGSESVVMVGNGVFDDFEILDIPDMTDIVSASGSAVAVSENTSSSSAPAWSLSERVLLTSLSSLSVPRKSFLVVTLRGKERERESSAMASESESARDCNVVIKVV
jgi:hypothetical protein